MIVVVLLLLLFQDRMIYHPRPYAEDPAGRYPGIVALQYQTGQGRQQAYYMPPAQGALPGRLWVVFPGNASRALDWVNFLIRRKIRATAFC